MTATLAGSIAQLVAAVATFRTPWEWRSAVRLGGEALHFRLDGVSAFFLVLLCVVGGAGSVYGYEYWDRRVHPRSAPAGRVWWSTLLLSMMLVLLASTGLQYLVGWEAATVSAYFLISLDRSHPDARSAGWLYLVMSHAAVLALFAFFSLLAARTGSWDLGPMQGRPGLAPLFWLVLFGHGIKAGRVPVAQLAAVGARECAQPRVGRPVRSVASRWGSTV